MKLQQQQLPLPFLLSLIAVFSLGTAAWWYLTYQAAEQETRLQAAKKAWQQLHLYPISLDPSSLPLLKKNLHHKQKALQALEQQILQPHHHPFLHLSPTSPLAWKQDYLIEAIKRMTTQTTQASITLPSTDGSFFFGFDSFQEKDPPPEATLLLTKQLYSIEQMVRALCRSRGVGELLAIRRTLEEAPSSFFDSKPSRSQPPPPHFVALYPLEIEFKGSPQALREFLNHLLESDLIFLVRSVQITHSQPKAPRLSELRPPALSPLETSSSLEAPPSLSPKNRYIFGTAPLHIQVQVDVVDWYHQPDSSSTARPAFLTLKRKP